MNHNDSGRDEGSQLRHQDGHYGLPLVLLYCLALALIYVLLADYTYGVGDHIEELPLIHRALDADYCPNDFYINTSQQFSPATYYVAAVSALARLLPLPVVMFGLAIAFNWASLLVMYLAARDLMDGSDIAAMVACTIMTAVRSIHPGGSAELIFGEAIPPAAAGPFVLITLWMALRGRYVSATAAAIPAMLIHPTLGLVAASVGIGGSMLATLAGLRGRQERNALNKLLSGAAALIVLLGLGWFFWMRHWETTLSTAEFVEVMGRFRTPHHRLPSTFGPLRMLDTVAFFAATVIALVWMARRSPSSSTVARRMGGMLILTVGLLAGGYLFVEVWPIRSFVALAAFRFLVIPKWLGFILFAGLITRAWQSPDQNRSLGGWIIFASNGALHGMSVLLGEMLTRAREGAASRLRPVHLGMLSAIGMVAAAGLWTWKGDLKEIALLWLVGSVSLLTALSPRGIARAVALVVAVLGLTGAMQFNQFSRLPFIGDDLRELAPEITLRESATELMPVSEFARTETAADALFVAPPDFALFRVTARRSLVADFKCVPFDDEGMSEWYARMSTCYGPIEGGGMIEQSRMIERWAHVSDARLRKIADLWHADYAVLYAETSTELERVYEGQRFTVVDLRQEG